MKEYAKENKYLVMCDNCYFIPINDNEHQEKDQTTQDDSIKVHKSKEESKIEESEKKSIKPITKPKKVNNVKYGRIEILLNELYKVNKNLYDIMQKKYDDLKYRVINMVTKYKDDSLWVHDSKLLMKIEKFCLVNLEIEILSLLSLKKNIDNIDIPKIYKKILILLDEIKTYSDFKSDLLFDKLDYVSNLFFENRNVISNDNQAFIMDELSSMYISLIKNYIDNNIEFDFEKIEKNKYIKYLRYNIYLECRKLLEYEFISNEKLFNEYKESAVSIDGLIKLINYISNKNISEKRISKKLFC